MKRFIKIFTFTMIACLFSCSSSPKASNARSGKELYISFSTTPASAKAFIDGKYQGLTPVTITLSQSGIYQVRIERAGYQTIQGRVSLDSDSTLRYELKKKQPVHPSPSSTIRVSQPKEEYYISISTTPASAKAFIDGKYQGLTPVTITLSQSGVYQVRIERSGYQTIQGRVSLDSDSTLRYELKKFNSSTSSLSPTPAPHKPSPRPKATPTPAPTRRIHEKRFALIIGNSDYDDSPLRNPENDARDVGNALRSLGFQVTTKTDVNKREFEDAVYEFSQQIRNGDIALFYFSGHGSQVGGENYLIPVREQIRSATDIRYKAVGAGYVLGYLEESQNRTNIMILDACRNNPFKGFKSPNNGFAPMIAPRGTFIAYATSPGSVAWEDADERNSVYTKYLLQAMKTRGVMIEQAFKQVLRNVEDETGGKQTPWIASSLRGDFYFLP